EYSVVFGDQGYKELSRLIDEKKYSKLFILTDNNVNEACMPIFLPQLATDLEFEIIEIEAGEENKTIETSLQLWQILAEFNADRKALIINIGGGMMTDLGGFIAATYKRGVDFVNIPTSLLAMVDASVGGKNGVNLDSLKNMIGTFTEPQLVVVDVNYLGSLPGNQMRSGLAEMFKHGLIADASYWNQLKDLSQLTTDDLELLIYHSVCIKNEIVQQDPEEKNMRKLLNFGHTLGHVIESYSLQNTNIQPLLHGEAIAIGMILEAYLSYKKGLLTKSSYTEIKETLNLMYTPIVFNENDMELCTSLLIHDKKNENGKILFTLLQEIGEGVINQSVESEYIKEAFYDYSSC
ncbi:MAG TPA: 3-dehydroquinate synthase, partial [Flavobacterium sp.]|nr:3-dehydroquinate synthase [Flavobacterium sp.]